MLLPPFRTKFSLRFMVSALRFIGRIKRPQVTLNGGSPFSRAFHKADTFYSGGVVVPSLRITPITRLLYARTPLAVLRAIVTVVIYPIKLKSGRHLPHVCKKVSEIKPPIAHENSATTVIFKPREVRIMASAEHVGPASICAIMYSLAIIAIQVGSSVLPIGGVTSNHFFSEASTTPRTSNLLADVTNIKYPFRSAITSTQVVILSIPTHDSKASVFGANFYHSGSSVAPITLVNKEKNTW